jgi:hypothetical protein
MKKLLFLATLGLLAVNAIQACAEQKNEKEQVIITDLKDIPPFTDEELEDMVINFDTEEDISIANLFGKPIFEKFYSLKTQDAAKKAGWSFNSKNVFKRGELVLVGRSNQCYAYGIIVGVTKTTVDEWGTHHEYRVQVGKDKLGKDGEKPGFIGKLEDPILFE